MLKRLLKSFSSILLAKWRAPKFGLPFCVVTLAWLTANEFNFELTEIVGCINGVNSCGANHTPQLGGRRLLTLGNIAEGNVAL